MVGSQRPVFVKIFTEECGTEQEAILGSPAVQPGEISSLGSHTHLQEAGRSNSKALCKFNTHCVLNTRISMEKEMATHSSILAWKIP